MTTGRIRVCHIILLGLLFYSFAIRIHLTWNRRFNADEFQHLHAAWMVHSGYFPYRDFWDNHTPLLQYFLTSGFSVFEEGIPLMMFLRGIMSSIALLVVWMTYRIARLDHDRFTSFLCALVLSFSVLFLQKTIEIRPDQFLVIFWLASFWIYIRFFPLPKHGVHLILAGVLLGVGMLFSPKALLCLAAAIVTFVTNSIVGIVSSESKTSDNLIKNSTSWFRFNTYFGVLRDCLYYTLGFFIPLAVCALVFWQKKLLGLLLNSTVIANLEYPDLRTPTYLLSLQHMVFFILAISGIVVCALERNIHRSTYRSRLLIFVPSMLLVFVFLFVMPAPFPQSALIFVPFLAIYAGIALQKSLEPIILAKRSLNWKQKLFLAFTLFTAVIVPCGSIFVRQPTTASNVQQLDLIRAVLNYTNEHDVIFDGNAAYIFRPQAYYYGSLVEGIRERIARGEIKISIPESLRDNHCKFIIFDDRVARLPNNVQEFIRNNYIPTQFPSIFIAGRELRADDFSGRKARFWIEIPLSYSIQLPHTGRIDIDGKPYTSPIFLRTGFHELVSDRKLIYVLIRATNGVKLEKIY